MVVTLCNILYICHQLLNEKYLKNSFNKLMFSYNMHFNYRWHCYMTTIYIAVAPSSVQLVWSQLHPALLGTFVLNEIYIIRRYIYSTCQGLYLFQAV